MKPIIVDNFLPDIVHKSIQKDIEYIKYSMLTNVSGVKDREINASGVDFIDNQIGFGETIFDGNTGASDNFGLYSLLLDSIEEKMNIKINKLFRMRVGVSINVNKPGSHLPHTDFHFPHNTVLYYVNDCNGDTIFYDEYYNGGHPNEYNVALRNKPTANQAVLFNGLQYHSSSNTTDAPYRAAVNINFE